MIYLIIAIFGALIGSFLNVVIERLHRSEPFLTGRSHCDACQKVLKWFELLPVVSFVVQLGACRGCKKRIAVQHIVLEVVTASLFVLTYYVFSMRGVAAAGFWLEPYVSFFILQLGMVLMFVAVLIVIFVYDLKYYLILDKVTFPTMAAVVVFRLLLEPSFVTVSDMLLGAFIGGGFFLFQFVVSKGTWIGGGDIRLGVVMGLMLGWKFVLLALLLAYISGAVIGIGLMLAQKKHMGSRLPFGTFLSAATVVTLLWGEQLLAWYTTLVWST